MSTDLQVPINVRLTLTHAALQWIADTHGVRVLHVKGVALHPVLRKGRRQSTDCDVLVHPADVSAWVEALTACGWEQFTTFEHGSVFEHAATFYHPHWGTADVHRAFPGLERDATRSFERLWDQRESVTMGGIEVMVPSLTAQRLIIIAHVARDYSGALTSDRLRAWDEASEEEQREVHELARELGAEVAFLIGTGRSQQAVGLPGARVWLAVASGASPTVVWVARLREAHGVRGRAIMLWRALHVNGDHLRLQLGHVPSQAELRREWWDRLGRGGRRLMQMARRR